MRKIGLFPAVAVVLSLALTPASAQVASGQLTGKATDAETHDGLPGVTVVLNSSALQGETATKTGVNGDYLFQFLAPGLYTVEFRMPGYAKVRAEVKVAAAQEQRFDVGLTPEVTETVVVTGRADAVSTSPEIATSYDSDLMEMLPVARDINNSVALAPGVTNTGPSSNAVISGAMSYQNLYLVNGVVVNENLRGQPFTLFIEDAIQETTVQTGAVSAEYGRFSGGVINAITKQGGNEFDGTFRVNFENEDWIARTPVERESGQQQLDDVNEIFEATLGGRILTDRLWFFVAARDQEQSRREQTIQTAIPYDAGFDEQRLEGKVTAAITQDHRLIGSYFKQEDDEFGNAFVDAVDLTSIDDRSLPLEGYSLTYNGVVTPNFFLEGLYSERGFTFEDSGSDDLSFVGGTFVFDLIGNYGYNTPFFCGVCGDEDRDNENARVKGNYFLTTEKAGSHNLVFGADTFNDIRKGDNHQSGSDYILFLFGGTGLDAANVTYPVVGNLENGEPATLLSFRPIRATSRGTNFRTHSLFVNDRWRLNEKWTFNVGVRFDDNDGEDADGQKVIEDSRISPRLAVSYDPGGDGGLQVNASYGSYVSAVANTVADTSAEGGTAAIQNYLYTGPSINVGGNTTPTPQALAIIEDWWFNTYGGPTNFANLTFIRVPGLTDIISNELGSPYVDEYTLGVTKRLGSRGLLRADYVRRDFKDFYTARTDLSTGQATDPFGQTFDIALIENNDSDFERVYDGLHTAFQYRAMDRLNLGATWTWSHTRGNIDGETASSGAIAVQDPKYPEYKDPAWSFPRGNLGSDQRHKVRAWAVYDVFAKKRQNLSVSVLQSFFSGTPYAAVGQVISSDFVANPGYAVPPIDGVNYYYTPRGFFKTDDISRTDLSFNYSFFFKDVELFIQPEILNVFNEDGALTVNATDVIDPTSGLANFDPFTETPVEGVNFELGPDFGQPETVDDFQIARTFRFSVGVRF